MIPTERDMVPRPQDRPSHHTSAALAISPAPASRLKTRPSPRVTSSPPRTSSTPYAPDARATTTFGDAGSASERSALGSGAAGPAGADTGLASASTGARAS